MNGNGLDGILCVDKPVGFTSHDVVALVRRRFRLEKVGHGGTLDPSATGLLILLLGKATKLSDRIMGGDKVYKGVMRLGVETSTQDAEGEALRTGDLSKVTEPALREAMAALTGDLQQIPPMVSAIKKGGVALYKLARKGEVVEREPRLVHIYDFKLLEFGIPDSQIEVRCSKGTYVRTLCHDVGLSLGCYGHLATLRRLKSGNFDIAQAISVDALKKLHTQDDLKPFMLSMTTAV